MSDEVPQIGDRVSVTFSQKAGGERTVVGVWRQTTHSCIVVYDADEQRMVHIPKPQIILSRFAKV